jgi:ADP-heptose:LPS heptosyltransferase
LQKHCKYGEKPSRDVQFERFGRANFRLFNGNRSAVNIETGKRVSSLQELFTLYDEAFVRKAYQLALGRKADPGGLRDSVERLRRGDDRLSILATLRASPEGRRTNVFFPELDALVRPYRRNYHPVWGKLLRNLRLHKRVNAQQRTINKLQNQLSLASAGADVGLDEAPKPIITTLKQQLAQMPSRKVVGNVAIPARAWSERPSIERILVFKLDHFGDLFVAVRAFSLLRAAWPEAHITLVCGSWNVMLARELGMFDEIMPLDLPGMVDPVSSNGIRSWLGQCESVLSLNLKPCDLAIDLRHDLDTRLCLHFVEATFKAGYEDSYTNPWPNGVSPIDISLPQNELHAELRCTLLAQLIITTLQPPETHPIQALASAAKVDLPFPSRSYLLIGPSASLPNKTWAPERFSELLRLIHDDTRFPIVFVGAKGDRAAVAAIAKSLPDGSYRDLCGTPLADLPWIFAHARMFVGCDSGPGHLSALLGTPTISIYAGVAEPKIWQPLGPHVAIVHSQTPCSYCYEKRCPYDFRCMTEVSVQDVYSQVKDLLARTKSIAQQPN